MAENKKNLSYMIATLFGVGHAPKAPGTFGSLATLPIAFLLIAIGGFKLLIIGTMIISAIGAVAVYIVLQYSDDKDPSFIVIDEVIGQLITFILPIIIFKAYAWSIFMYLMGFALFRFFDIAKPFHVGYVNDNVSGTAGVILDDVIAGLYSTVGLTLIMTVYHFVTRTGA